MSKSSASKDFLISRSSTLFSCLLLLSFNLFAQSFDNTIYVPPGLKPEVLESVNDMAYWLEKSTGSHFEVKTSTSLPDKGVQLQTLDISKLSEPLKRKILDDGQSFYLTVDGTNKALITGTGSNSFINGIYTFLRELGFRWYMPGDAWTIVPRLDKTIKINQVYTPDFQNRSYFGTGGMNPISDLDPSNEFRKDFMLWNRRNRLSSDYVMKGHMGQAFYDANKDVLNNHPEYFCQHKPTRRGRIDVSNPAAVDLYVNWALQQVNPKDAFSVIGVEPADGSAGNDDCLPNDMPEIKTWSDKYFWLANKVAEQVEQKKVNAIVELYAYASHAAPPSFDLNKNIYPVIIPYAFQNVTDPKQFIELWQKKLNGRPMGIYDYWNITQWSIDAPQFNIYSIPQRLKFWNQQKITTINLESTNAKGPMGHALWIATQMMWDVSLPFEQLYNEFLNQCFGPAAPDIKRMYDRWSLHYQGPMDVILSLHDLDQASAKTKDESIQKRITELKAYVHYLKLYYDYKNSPSVSSYQELINYVYSIHPLRLVQTSALLTSYINKPTGVTPAQKGKGMRTVQNDAEVNFKKDLQENPNPYRVSDFAFDITKATPVKNKGKENYNPSNIIGQNTYEFYLADDKNVVFKVGAAANTQLTIKDDKEKVWFDKTIVASKQGFEPVNLKLPKGKYTLTFGDYSRICRILFPDDIAFFSSNNFYNNSGYPLIYIYVPKDVTEIVYRDQLGPGINKRGDWRNPDGQTVKPVQLKYDAYRVEVPPPYRGKVWVLNIGHRAFELLNIPDIFSLNNFEYKE